MVADHSIALQLRRLRGKLLNNQQVAKLWEKYVTASRALPTLELTRRDRRMNVELAGSSDARKETVSKKIVHANLQPRRLDDWVKINRVLRGAIIAPSQRRRLQTADIDELLKPRCGHWNIAPDGIPNVPDRLRKGFEWAEQTEKGWDKTSITIYVDSHNHLPLGIEASDFQTAIMRAADTWNRASIGIRIGFADSVSQSDIVASWSSESLDPHGVLSDSVVAHADFPEPNTMYTSSPPLSMCFNRLKLWSSHVGDDVNEPTLFDIESLALHEIGHCIGLFHRDQGSVMYEIVEKGRHRDLDNDTIQAARRLYSV